MPAKLFDIPDVGQVYLTKKRGQKNIRLRIDSKGAIKVSTPWSVPAKFALEFVLTKKDWIKARQLESAHEFYDGMELGKTSKLVIIEHAASLRSKLVHKNLNIYIPGYYNKKYDEFIERAIVRLLRKEAEEMLISRLYNIARTNLISYKSVTIKQLKGRWGSCDSFGNISLSLYLVQLPEEMIDYVIVHELVHISQMNHGSSFWNTLGDIYPDFRAVRAKMRKLQPRIYDAKTFMA